MNKTIPGGNIVMNALPREGHILVVDDDLGIRDFLSQLLEEEGYNVRTASNGQEAMTHLRQSVPPPCLVFLDLTMPVMDGWEFRAAQMKDEHLQQVPVVVLTADGHAKDKAAALGVPDFVQKPVNLPRLLSIIERYCARQA